MTDNQQARRILIYSPIPLWITGLFALCLAGLTWHTPLFPFLQAEEEALNQLATQQFFPVFAYQSGHEAIFPYQNLNLLRIAIGTIGQWFPVPTPLPWAAQTGLFFCFLTLLWHLGPNGQTRSRRTFFRALVLLHPLPWLTFLLNPPQALTVVLCLWALSSLRRIEQKPARYLFSLFLLSFSGVWGLVLALLLSLYGLLFFFPWTDRREAAQFLHPCLGAIAAVLPALSVFLLFSLLTQSLGGPMEYHTPTLFSNVSITTLLTGEWSFHFRELLQWIGNGLVPLPFLIPLYGLILLCGIAGYGQRSLPERPHFLFWAGAASLCLFIFAFSPIQTTQEWMLLLFLLFCYGIGEGLPWLQDPFHFSRYTRPVLVLCLAFVWASSQVWVFPAKIEKTRYMQTIHTQMLDHIQQWTDPATTLAVQYHPIHFAQLPNPQSIIPLGLRIVCPTLDATPEETILNNYPQLRRIPDQILLYASWDGAPARNVRLASYDPLGLLEPFFRSEQQYALHIYTLDALRKPALVEAIQNTMPAPENPYHSPTRAVPPDGLRSPSTPALGNQVGLGWSFEHDYAHTIQRGFAFGLSPDRSTSVIGQGSAGPGARDKGNLLGTLESRPFTLEGDDLRFYAAIPQECTANFFCLAVFQSSPMGPENPVKTVQSIHTHRAGAPLVGDTFYYIKPSHLRYSEGWVQGWRVVRLLREPTSSAWTPYSWALDGWKNQQAIWFAVDRDREHGLWLDHIVQVKRTPGYYWNFEDGTYDGWVKEGTAFGETPAIGAYGNQTSITGYEGNYFINTYHEGSDAAQGTLISPPFLIPPGVMSFRIGGGDHWNETYLELQIEDKPILRSTGSRSEALQQREWDLTPWAGKLARIHVVDHSSQPWGHILVDDICMVLKP